MRSSNSPDVPRSWAATFITSKRVQRNSHRDMQLSTAYPRGLPKRRLANGEPGYTLRILRGWKDFVNKPLPTGAGRTTLSIGSSCRTVRLDGSRGAVLFRTKKQGVQSG